MNQQQLQDKLFNNHIVKIYSVEKSGRTYWRAIISVQLPSKAALDTRVADLKEHFAEIPCSIVADWWWSVGKPVHIYIEIDQPEPISPQQQIQQILDQRIPEFFTSDHLATDPDKDDLNEDCLGMLVSKWSEWDICAILRVSMYALEDANFSKGANVLRKMEHTLGDFDRMPVYELTVK